MILQRNILKPAKKSNLTNALQISKGHKSHNNCINFGININLEFSKIKDRTYQKVDKTDRIKFEC
jgi:hypothetical protein